MDETSWWDLAGDPVALGVMVVLVLVVGILAAWYLRSQSLPFELPGRDRRLPEPPPEQPEAPVAAPEAPPPEAPAPSGPTMFERFRTALGRSRDALQSGLQRFLGHPDDQEALEALEEALISADVGVGTTQRLVEAVRTAAREQKVEGEALHDVLRSEMSSILGAVHQPLTLGDARPYVLLVVGVNGSGKTTTIGKLAHRFGSQGKKVMLAAADTFRAAAAEQLQVWAERAGADFVRLEEGADPGAVVYQALERAEAEGHDVVIIDTAGRLQTRKPLMEQLAKIRRVIQKRVPAGPHETLLVLDGTMGQNGMSQATLFHEATPLTGVVVTKLDGTAKGGMVLAIASELTLPVKLVGLGEQAEDLRDFEPQAFVDALV